MFEQIRPRRADEQYRRIEHLLPGKPSDPGATARDNRLFMDAILWVAYPKGGQLGTDLTRDVLAELVKAHGVQPVRQVSLDDVWSALRLRPA